jgi:hypothetical protein
MKTLIFGIIVGVAAFYLWPFVLIILGIIGPIVGAIIGGIFSFCLVLGEVGIWVFIGVCALLGLCQIVKLIY